MPFRMGKVYNKRNNPTCNDVENSSTFTMHRSSSFSTYSSSSSTPDFSQSPALSPSSRTSSRSSISEAEFENVAELLSNDYVPTKAAKDYILVIGGLGYIGSHTTLELLKDGRNVIIVDNLTNSHESAFFNIQQLSSEHWAAQGLKSPTLKLHKLDYQSPFMRNVLRRYSNPTETRLSHITGVIHFAGYKSVEESIHKPLEYYLNNVVGFIQLLVLLGDFGIYNLVFSSSATVYGSNLNAGKPLREEDLVHHPTTDVDENGLPFELTPGVKGITNPYGRTKYFCEAILADVARSNPLWRITALRYFNPVGCEPSGRLAEDPRQKPTNLFPVIAQVLTGEKPALDVFGSDWTTSDGTPVRDFIHVVDLARGHLAALATADARSSDRAFRAYNLGTGEGSTVAQVISCMEDAALRSIPVRYAGRRDGDVGVCVAATERASRELGWKTEKSLEECAADTWHCLCLSGKVAA